MNSKQTPDSPNKNTTDGIGFSAIDESSQLGINETFEILKNDRRRMVLSYLRTNDGAATLKELADYVTAEENNVDISSITSSQRKRVYVGLYQFHLPKMSDMDIIEYDKGRGTVTLTNKGLRICESHEGSQVDPEKWAYVYLIIAALGFSGLTISWLLSSHTLGLTFFFLTNLLLAGVAFYQLLIQ